MDTRLSPEEIRVNRRSKTDHSWYGRMAFPDPTNRPARTVMATQSGVLRETLVLEWSNGGKRVYRRPTIRECATFQTFPITYQFWGSTAETRYKLVGNAVPPVLAAAVARVSPGTPGYVPPGSRSSDGPVWNYRRFSRSHGTGAQRKSAGSPGEKVPKITFRAREVMVSALTSTIPGPPHPRRGLGPVGRVVTRDAGRSASTRDRERR